MKTEIDWSKAPEWAMAYAQVIYDHATDAKDFAWVCADGYNVNPFGNVEQKCHPYNIGYFTPDRFRLIEFRPNNYRPLIDKELPPIGSNVVVYDDGSLVYGQGESGEVLAHVEGCAVIRMSYGLGCFLPRCLRTPEQIAAEERAAAIKEMVSACHYSGSECTKTDCAALYDAGYRKQATND